MMNIECIRYMFNEISPNHSKIDHFGRLYNLMQIYVNIIIPYLTIYVKALGDKNLPINNIMIENIVNPNKKCRLRIKLFTDFSKDAIKKPKGVAIMETYHQLPQ